MQGLPHLNKEKKMEMCEKDACSCPLAIQGAGT
jgi:hypothetical protein